jgi:HPr kinase/phosphorylase
MYKVKLADIVERMSIKNLTEDVDFSEIEITQSDINRPAIQLAGFFNYFDAERVQIIGKVEHTYLETLDDERKKEIYNRLFSYHIPCLILSRELEPDDLMMVSARKYQVPILQTSKTTSDFMSEIIRLLKVELAPRISIHGVLVDVFGEGILITGESGIGKSETALELIKRGHRLVADDVVEIIKRGDMIIGRGKEHLRHFMEVRGVGIINIMDVFGIRSIRIQKRIEVKVQLREWDPKRDWDRHGLDEKYTEILGTKITQLFIPIFPGKNITVIAETIALNHMLKIYGFNAAKKLDSKLFNLMQSRKRTQRYLRDDTE